MGSSRFGRLRDRRGREMRKKQNTRDKVLGVCYITYNLSYGTQFPLEQPVYLWSDFFSFYRA